MQKFIGIFLLFLATGLCVNAQSGFDKKIAEALKQLNCAEPTEQEPVRLNAKLLREKDSIAVLVKVRIAPGWHIYQYVPANMPYIPIDLILKTPEGPVAAGKWEVSPPFPSSTDRGVMIYENDAWFVRKVWWPAETVGVIQTGLYYQTCDLRQCLPPVEKTFDLKVPAAND